MISDGPEIEVDLSFVSIAEGYNTELTCSVHGEPKPQVSWWKDGQKIDGNSRYLFSNTGSRHTLAIDNVQSSDFADYKCAANNRFGKDEKTIHVLGQASAAVLKRNKPLMNGAELEWLTISHSPVKEYRLRYRPVKVSVVTFDLLYWKSVTSSLTKLINFFPCESICID